MGWVRAEYSLPSEDVMLEEKWWHNWGMVHSDKWWNIPVAWPTVNGVVACARLPEGYYVEEMHHVDDKIKTSIQYKKTSILNPHMVLEIICLTISGLLADGLRCPTRDVPAFTARSLYAWQLHEIWWFPVPVGLGLLKQVRFRENCASANSGSAIFQSGSAVFWFPNTSHPTSYLLYLPYIPYLLHLPYLCLLYLPLTAWESALCQESVWEGQILRDIQLQTSSALLPFLPRPSAGSWTFVPGDSSPKFGGLFSEQWGLCAKAGG